MNDFILTVAPESVNLSFFFSRSLLRKSDIFLFKTQKAPHFATLANGKLSFFCTSLCPFYNMSEYKTRLVILRQYPIHVIQRPRAMAQVQSGGQCAGEVVLGPPDALLQTAACCQTAGDGGGEGAAGAVGVGIGNSPGPEPQRFPLLIQKVCGVPSQMAALDEDRATATTGDFPGGPEHVPFCFHRLAAEHLGLREVWRHQGTQRQ